MQSDDQPPVPEDQGPPSGGPTDPVEPGAVPPPGPASSSVPMPNPVPGPNPVTGIPGWDPATGPPGWTPTTESSGWNPASGPPGWGETTGPSSWNPASSPPGSAETTGSSGWNPASGPPGWAETTGSSWNPASGPPGWDPAQRTGSGVIVGGYLPPAPPIPPQKQPRGLSPFGIPARHQLENPLLAIVVTITGLAFIISPLLLIAGLLSIELWLLLFAAPLMLYLGRGALYASLRTNGVKITPTQFPDAHRMVVEAAARFDMPKVPDAYVVLGNGQLNAFAAGHGFRRFVAVNSDLFEIGGRAREPDALAFIIGHEVGHIAAGHTSYWRWLGMYLVPYLPILGSSLQRAQEYTADNHGYCYRHTGASPAMRTLAAGKYLNVLVGFDEMADRAAVEGGFFVWLVNGISSHPVLTWRMWALRDRSSHGRLMWRPKRPFLPPQPRVGDMPPYGQMPPIRELPPSLSKPTT